MTTITLAPDEAIHVIVNGHTILVKHITDGGGDHAVSLSGVDCDLEGEEPGLYYPTPMTTTEQTAEEDMDHDHDDMIHRR